MNKEYLEAFEIVYNNFDYLISDVVIEDDDVNICLKTIKEQLSNIKQALKRLEAIDNANPSEALECLEKVYSRLPQWDLSRNIDQCNTIKQALLKAQKEHKSLDLLMQELDCKDFSELRKYARCGYQTFRNAKGANYDNIIIDEAVIPSEALIEKSLKSLEIIKEKNVNMFGFKRDIKQLGNRFTYKYYQSNYGNYHSGFDIQELTEEEFNLLKGILNDEQ